MGRIKNSFKTIVWILFSAALITGAVLGGIYIENNTRIQQVEFEGNRYTDAELLQDAIDSPVGLLADSVEYNQLFEDLKTLPYVEDATASMSIRGTLTFRVYEREPLAMLVDGSRRVYFSEGGIKLPVTPEKVDDVPLVYGFSAEPISDTLASDAYKQVEQFLLEAKENKIGWITISEIAWNEREGVVALTYENGVKLLFGRDRFREKLTNWEAFYTDVVSQKGINEFRSIDLRFKDQIVTRHL